MEACFEVLKSVGQEHILKFYSELNDKEKELLLADVASIDWHNLVSTYESQISKQLDGTKLKPIAKIDSNVLRELPSQCIDGTTRCEAKLLKRYHEIGCDNIGQGKVAALLLAGGQGTRLGVKYPKGMYDVGLPSQKSLFQLQAERILKLAKQTSGEIIWYIMTSEATMNETKKFFSNKNHFGLDPAKIIFFEQQAIPCYDFNGKVLLDQKHKLSRSPDGNGGLYEALHTKSIINHMKRNGVEYVHVYCVDNILVRVCDPSFIGFCIEKQVDAGAKVVEKISPKESVGTICIVDDKFKVIEYSEIPDDIACKRDESTGKLVFNAGNICDHFFKVDFLDSINQDKILRYHIAIKKIPHISLQTGVRLTPEQPNGIKLEKFIFDVFEFTKKFVAWEVKREDEFSPLKNADGTERDNPTTARQALERAHKLGILTEDM